MAANNNNNNRSTRFKIVLLGESSVGKTCMVRALMGEQFSTHIMSTIGIDFKRKTFDINGNNIELEIWDTAGQEKFRTITSFHYRNARGIVLVYDITNRKSFDRMKSYWLSSIRDKADDLTPVFIAGNKVDLLQQREVTTEEGKEGSDRYGAYHFLETSSKTGEGVQELFSEVASVMASVWKLNPESESSHNNDRRSSIKLQHAAATAANGGGDSSKQQCCTN